MIKYALIFILGFIMGALVVYCWDYYRNMKEFNERQEKYKKMI